MRPGISAAGAALMVGLGLVLGAPAAAAQDGCYHDYDTDQHICPSPTTAAPATTAPRSTTPTAAPRAASPKPAAQQQQAPVTTAPRASGAAQSRTAATAATVAVTPTSTTSTTLAPTTTQRPVTLDTEPAADRSDGGGSGSTLLGVAFLAVMAAIGFALVRRLQRRSAA
jgi:hypothetical protein